MVRLTHTGKTLLLARTQLAAQAEESAKPLWQALQRTEAKWLKAITTHGENGVTRRDVNRLEALMDRTALESVPDVARWFRGEAPAAGLNGLGTQANYIARSLRASKWADIPFERVKQAFETMDARLRAGDISVAWTESRSGVASRFLPADVLEGWRARLDTTAAGIRDAMTEQVIRGGTWRDVADAVRDEFGDLHISGQLNAEDFARAYARGSLTRVANDVSTAASLEAGIDSFFNLGVPDDRQSEICAEASAWGSHTMQEWESSEFGPPPRHDGMNCRCLLIADVAALEAEELEAVA